MNTIDEAIEVLQAMKRGEPLQVDDQGRWADRLGSHMPNFAMTKYRAKPCTITINGHEVPEPMREAPRLGAEFFLADPYGDATARRYAWYGSEAFPRWLARGLCHTTREAAEAHARALLSFTAKP